MNFKQIISIAISFSVLLLSCDNGAETIEQKKDQLKDSLLSIYSADKDSTKREAVQFLMDNMDDTQEVIYTMFYSKKNRKAVNFNLLGISGTEALDSTLKAQKIGCRDTTVNDVGILTSSFLARQIDKAFLDWKCYPWSKKLSKDIFFNYLLPYKVFRDKPSEWRDLLSKQYHLPLLQLSGQLKSATTENVIDKFNMFKFIKADPLLRYYDERTLRRSVSPYFDEMVALGEGDCTGFSLMNVYSLRAMGIASTVDFIPLFGRINAGHAKAVYYSDSLRTIKPLTPSDFFGNKAKVIRYTYKKQKEWTSLIQPILKNPDDFALRYLMNSHWTDVTSSYNPVADVTYPIKENYEENYAYICVFNYGNWEPVFWGKKDGGSVTFKNMGTDIAYRIGVPNKQGIRFISDPFILGNDKKLRFYNGNGKKYDRVVLSKLNLGYWSNVVQDSIYTLSYLDRKGNWIKIESKKAPKIPKKKLFLDDPEIIAAVQFYNKYGYSVMETFNALMKHRPGSIEFNKVPKDTFLKLEEKGDFKHLSRIFLIDSLTHRQILY